MSVEKIFNSEGSLARSLAGYEHRPQQLEMATGVENIISSQGVLIVEAGTGTGKTLAYLVPAILSGKRVIISTGTRNLQDQVFFKDLHLLTETLKMEFDAVYLKGQENYVCLRRLDEFLKSPSSFNVPGQQLEELSKWARSSDTGDRAELVNLPDNDPVWRDVCSTVDTRLGSKCPFFEDCFVTRARRQAAEAQLVVVNHHLYFADLASRRNGGQGILGSHEVVIFDEAHIVEDVATSFFSITASSGKMEALLRDMKRALASPVLSTRENALIDHVRTAGNIFFSRIRSNTSGRHRLKESDFYSEIEDEYGAFDASLEAASLYMEAVKDASDTIIGQASFTINNDYNSITIYNDGVSEWFLR